MLRSKVNRIIAQEAKQWTACNQGWIATQPLGGGDYYVTATGHKARTVTQSELRDYVKALVSVLGGRKLSKNVR